MCFNLNHIYFVHCYPTISAARQILEIEKRKDISWFICGSFLSLVYYVTLNNFFLAYLAEYIQSKNAKRCCNNHSSLKWEPGTSKISKSNLNTMKLVSELQTNSLCDKQFSLSY